VNIVSFSFKPTPVTISAGSAITWTNQDAAQHTILSDTGVFQSAALDTNGKFTTKLDTPGTYAYHCSIHPSMKGTIVVK
jgi:plastocyanin